MLCSKLKHAVSISITPEISRSTSLYQQGRTCGGKPRRQPTSMRRPGMATFKQQNVEDFYEIGEVLGRWVCFRGLHRATGAASEFHLPAGLTWVGVWFSSSLRGPVGALRGRHAATAGLLLLEVGSAAEFRQAERWTHSLGTACSPGPSGKELMVAGCEEGDGSKLLIITRRGNLGGETLWRKLVGCIVDLRKLQIIF